MRHYRECLVLVLLHLGAVALAQQPASPAGLYAPGPDSKPQPGVPQGSLFDFIFDRSQIFPGTSRKITVYVPAQYRADKPAAVYVGLDDLSRHGAPVVFDNLIHKREMPVTIGIGLSSGIAESALPSVNPRFNRSFEFDGLNDNLARFLLEEVFPEVERRKTPEGLPIILSKDPNDRAAGGGSTGGIGSFTLAWERPDAFRRIFTSIGTFVGMRGGDRYPVLVRKTEPKPIRIFMQDGLRDGLPGFLDEVGDWWMSNQAMQRALEFSGYQVRHAWGEGGHDNDQAIAVFPDAMRFLWKDWPQPVTAGESLNTFFKAILVSGESWQPVAESARVPIDRHRIEVAQHREYWTDPNKGTVWFKSANGRKVRLDSGLKAPTAVALSPDGLWLAVAESRTHWGYSYSVRPDGTVQLKQKFYWFHVSDEGDASDAGNWIFDRDGRLYAATQMGVQVFDRNGRVRAIMPVPGKAALAVRFGGERLDTLYIDSADGRQYRRKLKVSGLAPGADPIALPQGSRS